MVKSRAVADPGNQYWIRTYCEKYPRMKMVLAHAARSFNPNHAIEGMQSLSDLPNLWCDMAAVSEVGACEAIIDVLGHKKLLWGSDFPVSNLRSRCVAIGDGFVWLTPENLEAQLYGGGSFVLHGLESLRVLKQAAWHRRLNDSQVEDIFFRNLADMIGIDRHKS
jgi:glutamate-1-semialdehyde 2,1-aminomutase